MKPITDDVVQSLLNGLEMREKKALKKLHDAGPVTPDAGAMTASILRFGRGLRRAGDEQGDVTKVLDLVEARRLRHAKRTRSGLFSFSPQI